MTDLYQTNAPFSAEAEEAVIGSILTNPSVFLTLASFITPEDFYLIRHQYIWQALLRIAERNEVMDYLTLKTELEAMGWLDEIGGVAYLTQLLVSTPNSVHAEFYGRIVERTAIRRRLMKAADEIKALAMDEQQDIDAVIGAAETRLFNVTDRQVKREFIPLHDAVGEYFDLIEHMMQTQQSSFGVPSGFKDLDQLLGGLQRSDLLIFAGRPGMGKCVAAGTLVSTDNGLVPIETLKPEGVTGIPDDEGGIYYPLEVGVQSPTGRRETAYFYDSGLRPTLKFTTRGGYSLSGTHRHPVLTLAPNGEKLWKPLSEIQSGDFVAIIQHGAMKFERVTAIQDSGIQHCYDLTIPDGHAFVTNGIVSHNTSFLLSISANAARLGARVAIFTMEMGADQIVQRLISMETGINTQKLRLGQLSPQEYSRFVEAAGRISRFNIFIDDTPALSPIQMRTKCRRLMHEHGLDLVIVDYMQLMNAGGQYQNNRVQEISYISRSLKELARELNVPMFSAAQLSRAVEQRQDKRPVLSDLRESGCLTGDSPVYLPDEGRHVPIRDLVGKSGFRVLSLNEKTWKLEAGTVTNAFSTGVKPVYRLTTRSGRTIRATGNHKFRTICGWKRLDELTQDDLLAVPDDRQVGGTQQAAPLQTISAHDSTVSQSVPLVDAQPVAVGFNLRQIGGTQQTAPLQSNAIIHPVGTAYMPSAEHLRQNDILWDGIASIEPDGVEEVFDLTVDEYHNFVSANIVVHNSIEQDADIVMFLYRDVVYNEGTEFPNQADVIVSKHRNGPTGTVSLYFDRSLTKFMDGAVRNVNLGDV